MAFQGRSSLNDFYRFDLPGTLIRCISDVLLFTLLIYIFCFQIRSLQGPLQAGRPNGWGAQQHVQGRPLVLPQDRRGQRRVRVGDAD